MQVKASHVRTFRGAPQPLSLNCPGRLATGAFEHEITILRKDVSERRTWKFADDETQWQHDLLVDLVADAEQFFASDVRAPVTSMNKRLELAEKVAVEPLGD
jgi:hypothetical protein